MYYISSSTLHLRYGTVVQILFTYTQSRVLRAWLFLVVSTPCSLTPPAVETFVLAANNSELNHLYFWKKKF